MHTLAELPLILFISRPKRKTVDHACLQCFHSNSKPQQQFPLIHNSHKTSVTLFESQRNEEIHASYVENWVVSKTFRNRASFC